MSIRTKRRLGDATTNIATAVWGNPQYAVASGQTGLVNSIAQNLTSQGIDPATATNAQIQQAYQVANSANIAAQLAAMGIPASLPTSQPTPTTPVSTTAASSLASIPQWVYWAAGLGALFIFGGNK